MRLNLCVRHMIGREWRLWGELLRIRIGNMRTVKGG